ncbi:hypothetical protein PYCCODRAFT_1431320 [Trametes coccinea BRFM310]|uniref:Uncharacterized protein n=1 Tax=Trametes coccinea (strain BRFM310) TaxID=1353009 RepID=A0A1Y2IYV5_TRAC3|nr:hypothetical protein PYCCODRAFT_1431320 [Trametes coccinea BRFM310]
MRFFISTIAAVALPLMVLGQDLKINTLTSATECQPVQFSWQGGSPPYYLELVPGGQPMAPAIKQFPAQNGNVMTWTVDLAAGTSFSSSLRDSSGTQAFSDIQTVQAGPDNSCMNTSGSTTMPMTTATTASDTSAASINSATTTSLPAVAQKAASTTSSAASSVSSSGTGVHALSSGASVTSAVPTSSNAASLHTSAGAIGVAGLLGLVGAALLG